MNRRPQLSIVAPGASPEEAAAVVAAIEQFMRATAPPVEEPKSPVSGWLQAARHEGVACAPQPPVPWQ